MPYQLKFPVSWIEFYNLHHTDGVVVGNQDGAKILRGRGYQKALQVMPQLGVDESLFRPQAQPELAAKLGILPHEFVVDLLGVLFQKRDC